MSGRQNTKVGLLALGVSIIMLCAQNVYVMAASATISHSYRSTDAIPRGSIVSLDPKQVDYVKTTDTGSGSRVVGVAVGTDDSLLAVNPNTQEAQIATDGTVLTLVTTLNGNIKPGDQLSVSPLKGVGQKAKPGARIIGLATASFSAGQVGATNQKIAANNGKIETVSVGFIPVTIRIDASTATSSAQLQGVQATVFSLTGHKISTTRILLALLVAIISLFSLITLIYGSIYSSVISIGRNPLAKYAILRNLFVVLGMASLMSITAAIIVFFLLR